MTNAFYNSFCESNVTMFACTMHFFWNWLESVVCDDIIFITSYINDAIGDETKWPKI